MTTQHTSPDKFQIERVDDVPLLIAFQQQMGLDDIYAEVIPRHWLHQGFSLGQLVVGWNAYILSAKAILIAMRIAFADHRKVAVEQWGVERQGVLSERFGIPLRRTDFTDDRLSQVAAARLRRHEGGGRTPVRSPTPASERPPADDSLYLPMIHSVRQMVNEPGLLYIGDSKMSAIEIRAELARKGDFYLVPLAKVGGVAALLEQCLKRIVSGSQPATLTDSIDEQGRFTELIAAGYQTNRVQTTTGILSFGMIESLLPSGETFTWQERLLVVRSLAEAKKQFATLQRNLQKATEAETCERRSLGVAPHDSGRLDGSPPRIVRRTPPFSFV